MRRWAKSKGDNQVEALASNHSENTCLGCSQVTLRTWMLMISDGDMDSYGQWLMPLFVTLWVIFSLATVVYVRIVFKRYN